MSMSMTMSMTVLPVGIADLPGHLVGCGVTLLSGHLLADWPGHLPLMMLGNLVALLLNMLLADGAIGLGTVSLGLSLSLVVGTAMDNLGVMANNSAGVVDLLAGVAAVLGDNVLTLFNVGGVNNHIIFLVTHLIIVGMTLLLVDNIIDHMALHTVLVVAGSSKSSSSQEKSSAESVHLVRIRISSHQREGGAEANCICQSESRHFIVWIDSLTLVPHWEPDISMIIQS